MDEAIGQFLKAVLCPPRTEGPPFTHVFTLPAVEYEDDDEPEL